MGCHLHMIHFLTSVRWCEASIVCVLDSPSVYNTKRQSKPVHILTYYSFTISVNIIFSSTFLPGYVSSGGFRMRIFYIFLIYNMPCTYPASSSFSTLLWKCLLICSLCNSVHFPVSSFQFSTSILISTLLYRMFCYVPEGRQPICSSTRQLWVRVWAFSFKYIHENYRLLQTICENPSRSQAVWEHTMLPHFTLPYYP